MQKTPPSSQSGNILFLILIAVALFAALSFAVSQSMRGNSNSIQEEQGRIDSAYLTQFPTMIRQGLVRMRISNTLAPEDISFARPGDITYGAFNTTPDREVFNPQGGAIPYQSPPANINDGTEWIFNGDIEIQDVGSTTGTATSSDLVAFLPGVRLDVCQYTNQQETGVLTTPPTITLGNETNTFTGTFGYADTLSDPALNGKETFCYYSTNLGKYVYYQVLIAR